MKETSLALQKHREWKGKIEVVSRVEIKDRAALSLAYTPGVADACLDIAADPDHSYDLTRRWNLVAVVTDGTAVLGLGDIGPEAGMPVMEGKCALFKQFADVDAFPLCIDSKDPDDIVRTVQLISKSFGGINLEDISAPRCFEVERRLKEVCDIPIFHDDQHGTAVVVGAALINACRLTGRELADVKVVFSGSGAAGSAVADFVMGLGVKDVIICSRGRILNPDLVPDERRKTLLARCNPRGVTGSFTDALAGADVLIGLSVAGMVNTEMVRGMAADPIVFPMANPTPEIMPEYAFAGGAKIVGTGRSDYPNQINNVLAFPGIFKGALSVRASDITLNMKVAAAHAIADFVGPRLAPDFILPNAFDAGLSDHVAEAVAKAARADGVARI